jgi:hypothetical protein
MEEYNDGYWERAGKSVPKAERMAGPLYLVAHEFVAFQAD